METDERDRQKEREELEDIRKKLLEDGHPDPEAEMERVRCITCVILFISDYYYSNNKIGIRNWRISGRNYWMTDIPTPRPRWNG